VAIGKTPADYPNLTVANFLVNNLIPVTLGNIVGAAYWFIYLRAKRSPVSPHVPSYDVDKEWAD
jgi:formate transporter